jgi:cytochrome P450
MQGADVVTEFFLPRLPRLLPFAYHPRAAQIEIASNGWMRRFLAGTFGGEEQFLRFLRQRNGIYGPLTVPRADYQRALDIADWYQFVTVIDSAASDRHTLGASVSGAHTVFARILTDFSGSATAPGLDDSPFGRAARDLWRRISPGLGAAQARRFQASLAAFLRGCAAEIDAKLDGRTLDYEDCMAVRAESFGCEFIELMTEYGAEADMSGLLVELAPLHHHCRRQMILVNDLLSWRKERSQDDKMTAVRVLTEREGLSLQQAVDELCRRIELHERAYIAERDLLLAGPLGERGDVRSYLDGVDHLIGGSQEFEYLTPRYFGDGSVWDGSTYGWIDLEAPVARFRPEPGTRVAPADGAMAGRPAAGDGAQSHPASGRPEHDRDRAPAQNATPPARTWKVVTPRGSVPVLGHALPLWRRPLEFLAALPADADLVEIRLGPKRAFLAHHPQLVHRVLTESRTFDKGGPLFEKARLLVGDGLVSSAWEPHRRQRRLLQPAFHPSRLPGYVELMGEQIREELSGWRSGETLDVGEAMHALTLKITARTMFATTAGPDAIAEVAFCMPVIMRGVYKRMTAPLGVQEKLPTRHNRQFEQVRIRMRRLIERTVAAHRACADGDRGDLLSMLIRARDPRTGDALSDREIHDQVMTLLIGGTETTGNTMAWAFHVLATHPEVESRLHTEVDRVLGGRVPTFEDLPRLDYTARVITEVLRMYPPAWLLTRATTREVEVAGRRLAAGTTVMYSPYALGRHRAIFTDPERFDPDRWLPDRGVALPRGNNVPFGGGGRKCIGDAVGMAETTITLAAIAGHWRLRAVPGTRVGTAVPRASLGTGPLPMIPERRVRRRVGERRAEAAVPDRCPAHIGSAPSESAHQEPTP